MTVFPSPLVPKMDAKRVLTNIMSNSFHHGNDCLESFIGFVEPGGIAFTDKVSIVVT